MASPYSSRTPASTARKRAAIRDTRARKVETEKLYTGTSPAARARARAAGGAAKDKASQASRVARGGVGSSAAAQKRAAEKQKTANREPRTSTKAKEVQREGLYTGTSPADRARARAAKSAGDDAASQKKRDVTSPEYAAEKERKKREAEERKKKAEAKAKELEAKAKAARDAAENLKGKEKKAAKAEAEKLEAEAKAARQEAKNADREPRESSQPGQDDGLSAKDKAADKKNRRNSAQPPAPKPATPPVSTSPRLPVSTSSDSAPISTPPVIINAAQGLQRASTKQAWDELDTQLKTL